MTSPTPRALIVEDDPEILALLQLAFGRMPFDTVLVARGVEALVEIFAGYKHQRPFDVLILDCALPHVDGFTIAKIVRMIEKTDLVSRPAKIGFFTAFSETVEQSTLLAEVKADAYWRKPDDAAELPYLVASWLKVEVAKASEH